MDMVATPTRAGWAGGGVATGRLAAVVGRGLTAAGEALVEGIGRVGWALPATLLTVEGTAPVLGVEAQPARARTKTSGAPAPARMRWGVGRTRVGPAPWATLPTISAIQAGDITVAGSRPRSVSTVRAALRPGRPDTDPPGCVVAPVMKRPGTAQR